MGCLKAKQFEEEGGRNGWTREDDGGERGWGWDGDLFGFLRG